MNYKNKEYKQASKMSAYHLYTRASEDVQEKILKSQMSSIHLVKPSKKTLSILNKDLSEEEHNPYCIKSKSTTK